ncbi:MAG: phage Gp37/Gp68 family protein, partial [Elusimicrobiota bacterium]|nr:phage Gp37/Gp68 family protein [Elusimicrobiota bacterium]
TIHPNSLELPLQWKKPQMIFVNSMSDLFHKKVPVTYIKKVFDVMNLADWHTFQVLTKRSNRLLKLNSKLNWTENVWMGVSVEDKNCLNRIDDLRKTNAKTKFISFEPLLGPLPKVNLKGMDWVIIGGESGPGARPMNPKWVTNLRDQCIKQKVPFFFKQWGGVNKKKTGRLLNGRTWDEMPACGAMKRHAGKPKPELITVYFL